MLQQGPLFVGKHSEAASNGCPEQAAEYLALSAIQVLLGSGQSGRCYANNMVHVLQLVSITAWVPRLVV